MVIGIKELEDWPEITRVVDVSIPSGDNVSEEVLMRGRTVAGIAVDADGWDGNAIRFQARCDENDSWRDVYGFDGNYMTLHAGQGYFINVLPKQFGGACRFRIIAGNCSNFNNNPNAVTCSNWSDTNQTEDRTIRLVVQLVND